MPMTEDVDLDLIETGANYRTDFSGIEELAASIETYGLLSPLVVRPSGDRWRLVAGERRLRALRLLGRTTAAVVIRDEDDAASSLVTLVENEQRANPNPMEQAGAFSDQVERWGRTVDEIAEAIGRKPGYVRDRLALLDLSHGVQAGVASGALPHTVALSLRDLDHNRQVLAVRDFSSKPLWTAEQFKQRVHELRSQQEAEAQTTIEGEFMQVAVFELEGASMRRKIGAIGMARILERLLAEGVEMPGHMEALVVKAIEDQLGEKAVARRDAAHRAWTTMKKEKHDKAS